MTRCAALRPALIVVWAVYLAAASLMAQTPSPSDRQIGVRLSSAAQLPHADENWLVAVGVNRFREVRVRVESQRLLELGFFP